LQGIGPASFVSRWNTSKTGTSSDYQIELPIYDGGNYDFTIDWGDNTPIYTINNYYQDSHTYSSEGEYTVVINGTLEGWRFYTGGDKLKIIEISQWGNLNFGNLGEYFYGCANLVLTATDAPDLTGTTMLRDAFRGCSSLGGTGSMDSWDMSSVTHMFRMFLQATTFNQPIGNWDMSSVTSMYDIFYGASSFNQPIGDWDLSSVTSMSRMFYGASSFNQPIGDWNVSSVNGIHYMFYGASSFNQPIGDWDVSSVTSMYNTFSLAASFNQPIGDWNVSSVTDMRYTFYGASSFNQPIGDWNVSSVNFMNGLFYQAPSFNQPIGDWDVSSVTIMEYMFYQATSFNQPIGNWDVSGVGNMVFFLSGVTLYHQYYDDLLIKWASLPSVQSNVNFHTGNSVYSSNSFTAKYYLENYYSWTITDGGLFASTPPDLTNPSNIEYSEGETGNEIQWILGDKNPGDYNISMNGSPVSNLQAWSNGSVTLNVDGLTPNVYEFTIFVYDAYGCLVTDSVIITVKQVSLPIVSKPDDISYDQNSAGNQIIWAVEGIYPENYNVTLDGVLYLEDSWTNGTIIADIDDLDVGLHEFQLNVFNIYGNQVSDIVLVAVYETTTETETDTITETQTDIINGTVTDTITEKITEITTLTTIPTTFNTTDTTDAPIFFTFAILGFVVVVLRRRK
jgi:surface protein